MIKLHLHAIDHLLEVQGNAEETGQELDTDYLFSQSFFMGIVGGIVLEKCQTLGLSTVQVSKTAQKYIKSVVEQTT